MFGSRQDDVRFTHVEQSLARIERAVAPLATNERVERVEHSVDRLAAELKASIAKAHERIDAHESQNNLTHDAIRREIAAAVQPVADRVTAMEGERSEARGAVTAIRAVWGVVGGGVVAAIAWLVTSAIDVDKRLTIVDQQVESLSAPPKRR